jgi:hypothetical protein
MSKVRSNVRFSFGEVLLTIGVIEALMREKEGGDNRVCTCSNFIDLKQFLDHLFSLKCG